MPAIRVSALTKTIQTATHRVEILRGIDFDIQHGEFVAIMGPSGSGKSTLLGLLAGLDTPTSGQIILDGEDITGLERRPHGAAARPQSRLRFSVLSSAAHFDRRRKCSAAVRTDRRQWDRAAVPKRARELLESVGLLDRRDHYPVQLSGGEQQRVALARAFMVRPPILLGRRAHRQSRHARTASMFSNC